MNKKEIKKSLLSFFRKALLGLSVLCFIACFSYLIKYYVIEPYKNKNALETPSINESDTQTTMMANKSKHVLAKYKDLLEKNNDFVGILKIPLLDENDMKVVQGEDNEEYLYKNFNGEYSRKSRIIRNTRRLNSTPYTRTEPGRFLSHLLRISMIRKITDIPSPILRSISPRTKNSTNLLPTSNPVPIIRTMQSISSPETKFLLSQPAAMNLRTHASS